MPAPNSCWGIGLGPSLLRVYPVCPAQAQILYTYIHINKLFNKTMSFWRELSKTSSFYTRFLFKTPPPHILLPRCLSFPSLWVGFGFCFCFSVGFEWWGVLFCRGWGVGWTAVGVNPARQHRDEVTRPQVVGLGFPPPGPGWPPSKGERVAPLQDIVTDTAPWQSILIILFIQQTGEHGTLQISRNPVR